MNNIALLTWTTYENYGSFLQWFALKTTIEELGYTCTSVNYIPKATYRETLIDLFYSNKKTFFFEIVKKCYNKFINSPLQPEKLDVRHHRFCEFKKRNFKLTAECITASDLFLLNDKFDAFVCGSDQIWSPYCFDSHFYLDFVEDDLKKIAYAPSIGTDKIENQYIEKQVANLLKKIEYLSVREISGRNIINKLIDKDVPVVLDPTMLINRDDWLQFENTISSLPQQYILCYFLGNNEAYWRKVYALSKKLKIPLVIIPVYKKDFKRTGYVLDDIGPAEFVHLINNACFICSDSFHGTVFSIIFNKPMAVFKRFKKNEAKNQNTRLDSLLDIFNLANRIIGKYNNLYKVYHQPIQFDFINAILTEKQNISRTFLLNALEKGVQKREIDYAVTNVCCGCGACKAVCPEKAIAVNMNKKGFMHFTVDQMLCTHCKKCRTVCPYIKHDTTKITYSTPLYAVCSSDRKVLLSSSSGGIGFELMNYYKEKKTAVAGCEYDADQAIAKIQFLDCYNNENANINKLQGSKYIQSVFVDMFKQIDNVSSGIITGLPCQISAAHNYLKLKKRRDAFLLVDLICHGVPSQHLWVKYINEKKKKYCFKSNPDVIWRHKPLGWAQRFIFLSDSETDKNINIWSKKDDFYAFFLAGNCYLEACYECNYRDSSCADIRIGDYWGKKFKKLKTGMSMVLPLTENGHAILNDLASRNKIECTRTSINDYFNAQQTKNHYRPLEYDDVIEAFQSSILLQDIKKIYCLKYARREKIGAFINVIKGVII